MVNHMRNGFLSVLFLFLTLAAGGGTVFELPMTGKDALKGWTVNRCKAAADNSGVTLSLRPDELSPGTVGIFRSLPADRLRGRRAVFSIDVRTSELTPGPKALHFHGGKFQLVVSAGGRKQYPEAEIPPGSRDWTRISFSAAIPSDADGVLLALGFQNASGTLTFRKFTAETADVLLNLSGAANMGFADDVPGDGRGGWSDQGRDNDARNFDFRKARYGNVPFAAIDPAANGGRSVLVLRSRNFPSGPESAEVTVPGGGKRLYLLHTLTYGGTGEAGSIEAYGAGGRKQVVPVTDGRDVADWWHAKRLPNGWPGAAWLTGGGNSVGLYVSCFPLEFEPERIVFRSRGGEQVWIIAAATLSDREYPPTEAAEYVIREGAEWKPLSRPVSPRVVPGSVLDMSAWVPALPLDRVTVNRDGRLAFRGDPGKPVRFFCCSASWAGRPKPWNGRPPMMPSNFDTREKIDAFIDEMARQGYNMFRIHMPNTRIGGMENGEIKLKADELDRIDYFIAGCRKRRIYIMLDLLGAEIGYTGVSEWGHPAFAMHQNLRIYFDEAVRRQCLEGMRQLLTHVNPYTGIPLAEDPILALVTGWNEQEFAFIKNYDFSIAAPEFAVFLEKKYGAVTGLNREWGSSFASFAEASRFRREEIYAKNRRGADIDEFIAAREKELIGWYAENLRKLGYEGLFTNYDMTKSLHYAPVRGRLDVVSMHNYHGHPDKSNQRGSSQNQGSALEGAAAFFRDCAATRIAGKPMVINEYAQLWWNRCRYEEPFAFSAYAALHGYDALMRHAHPVSTVNAEYMASWESFWDPVAAASQVATAFLFLRGDVAPAKSAVRLQVSEAGIHRDLIFRDSVDAAQNRLALITGFGLENIDGGSRPPGPRELAVPLAGSSAVENSTAGFSRSLDRSGGRFDLGKTVAELKRRGLLPEKNRSGSWTLFESETGELLLDAGRRFMRIDTPRFQGVCGPAGTTAALADVSVERLTTDGTLSVIALDGTVRDANRLLVIYATNALNSGTSFEDESMRTLLEIGRNPSLIRTGAFELKIRNRNASSFKVYPLAMNGERRAEIPASASGGVLAVSADTAKLPDGPALFFEIVR